MNQVSDVPSKKRKTQDRGTEKVEVEFEQVEVLTLARLEVAQKSPSHLHALNAIRS